MDEEKDYNPLEAEPRILKFWEQEQIYKFNPSSDKPVFSIDTPPPTVSGEMHIGHAFSYSQQDFIARFMRMKSNVFYPFGTDDNGLPTERLIEKIKKIKSKEISRQDFINLCVNTLKEITPQFIQDWKNLGISCDYNIYYSTIDENSRKMSQKSFLDLFNKGLVYKKDVPTIWCPECQTAIAQAELEDSSENSLFSTIAFSVEGNELPVSTTRPELLPACVAVFINPKDKRYKSLAKKKAIVPLFNYEVPIIEDSSADMEKGTGVLMICSYGDKFDVDAIARHKLEPRVILSQDGTLNIEKYKNLKVREARKQILQDLQKEGLVKEQKNITHDLNVHDKCGTPIEFISTEQWFIKILDQKKKLIEQGKKIKWFPEFMFKRYKNWISGLNWDWSISRDRHFGIPIPVYQCKKCNSYILPKEGELPIDPQEKQKKCPKCNQYAEPETKVLDTWATSSLTPQIASSLSNKKINIPFSLRPQAHDIIRTWAFYTIIKSLFHENEIPWKSIMISGFVTLGKEKMSKSKGNVINPKEVSAKYGADALRFWAASSKLGEDLAYQEKDIVTAKKFITKLWNATRFAFMNINNKPEQPKNIHETDRIFLNQLNSLIKSSTKDLQEYNYSSSSSETENFFWSIFCDNYLEIIKKRIYQGSEQEKASAQYVLYHSLLAILKLMAPFTPFITEELYQKYFRKYEKQKSIHISEWPLAIKIKTNTNDNEVFNLLIETISKVRQEKSKASKSMKAEIILSLSKQTIEKLSLVLDDLKAVTNAKEIKEREFNVQFL